MAIFWDRNRGPHLNKWEKKGKMRWKSETWQMEIVWNQVHFVPPQGSMILSMHPEPVYSGFWHQPIFLHRNRYLCIFYKHSGHLSMAAHRWDRLPLSLARLAQETRWPAKRCAKPATDRAQLDLNPFNSCHCLLHTNRKWLAPSKGVNPYLDHAVLVSPRLDGLANQLIYLDQSVTCESDRLTSNDTMRSTGVW